MTKYTLKEPYDIGDAMVMPGDMFEIKKLKHPVTLSGIKFKYKEIETGALFKDKKSLKERFTKGTYKSETPKRIIKTLLIIALYELSKYVTNEIIIKLTANDEIDTPLVDYEIDGGK